jgi:hypothetical protein
MRRRILAEANVQNGMRVGKLSEPGYLVYVDYEVFDFIVSSHFCVWRRCDPLLGKSCHLKKGPPE